MTIHENDKDTKDTRNRTAKRKIAIKRMNGILSKNMLINIKKSIVMYGAEA